ncbi:MAG: tetratricopeptide repeat protein [bacterium]|nr:tetratricopeptide repeat protein [bacterium]
MKKLQDICFALFFIVPPLLVIPSFYEGYGIPKQIIIWLLIPFILLTFLSREKKEFMLSTPLLFWGLFLILNFTLLCFNQNKYYGLERVYLLLTYFILFLAAINFTGNKRFVIISALVGFGIISLIGVLQYINIIHINWEQLHWEKGFGKRVFSTLGNPNALASYSLLFLPVSMILSLSETRTILRNISLLIFLLGFSCLLFTNSWGSWISFLIAVIITIIFFTNALDSKTRNKIKLYKKNLFFVLAAILVITSLFVLTKRGKIMGEPTGAIARTLLWETSFSMVKDKSLTGFGPNGFLYYSNKYLSKIEIKEKYNKLWLANPNFILRNPGYPENEYLTILVDTGIIGIGLFLFFIISLMSSLKHTIKETNSFDRLLAIGVFAGVVGIFINSLIDIPFSEWTVVGAIFFVLIGLTCEKKTAFLTEIDSPSTARKVKAYKQFFAICICLISLLFISKGIRTLMSDIYVTKATLTGDRNKKSALAYYQKSLKFSTLSHTIYSDMGQIAYKKGDYKKAIEYFNKSIALLPFHEALYYNIGSVYQRMGNFTAAESSFIYALKLEPRYSSVYARLVSLYRKENLPDKASQTLMQGIHYLPDDAALNNELGILYAEQKNTKQALRTFERTLILSRYDPIIWYNLYLLTNRTNTVSDSTHPNFMDISGFEWVTNMFEENRRKPEYIIKEVLAEYPDYPDALLLYAKYAMKNDDEEALRILKKAFSIAPNLNAKDMLIPLLNKYDMVQRANTLLSLAAKYYTNKDLKSAEYSLSLAIEYNPILATAYFNFGILLRQKNDYDKAIIAWHKFIALDPTNKDVPGVMAEISKLSAM